MYFSYIVPCIDATQYDTQPYTYHVYTSSTNHVLLTDWHAAKLEALRPVAHLVIYAYIIQAFIHAIKDCIISKPSSYGLSKEACIYIYIYIYIYIQHETGCAST
jgi:hypothetical protein